MPRQKNTRPTSIYWLIDTRTNTPFYCGKTVQRPEYRLGEHRRTVSKFPNRSISKKLKECGEFVRVEIVETVPAGADWVSREKRWIELLQFSFEALNSSEGGQGATGYVHTLESRMKMSVALKGKRFSPARCAQMSEQRKGKAPSAETRAKLSASLKGNKSNTGRKLSVEHRTNMSEALKGKSKSPAQRAKMSASAKAWRAARREAIQNAQ